MPDMFHSLNILNNPSYYVRDETLKLLKPKNKFMYRDLLEPIYESKK